MASDEEETTDDVETVGVFVVTERAGGEGRFSTQHLMEPSEHVTFSRTFSQRRAANT